MDQPKVTAVEVAAQSAAIWFVLETLMRSLLSSTSPENRRGFLNQMLAAAETLQVPASIPPDEVEMIANRYDMLLRGFAERIADEKLPPKPGQH